MLTMLTVALSLFSLVSSKSSNAQNIPYEEDPVHFHEQYILHVVTINERLYTKSRNHQTSSHYRCQSADMIEKISDTEYKYKLRARNGNQSTDPYVEHKVYAKLFKTGKHSDYNAASITMPNSIDPSLRRVSGSGPGTLHEVHTTMKLMTMNDKETCFVFVVETGGNQKQCEILMTATTAAENIPEHCKKVYEKDCPGPYLTLYDNTCQ
uniref:Putative licpodalin-4 1 n=1 Tax=Amblyomma triste TaxID=251400 RepID=A0A023GDG8_AMBTT